MAISRRFNGGIIGVRNISTPISAVGMWTTNEIQLAKISNLWPEPPVGVQIFTTSSSWVAPTGVSEVEYLVVAGGGGGGGAGTPGAVASGGVVLEA